MRKILCVLFLVCSIFIGCDTTKSVNNEKIENSPEKIEVNSEKSEINKIANNPVVTSENFDKIVLGMEYDEVCEIFEGVGEIYDMNKHGVIFGRSNFDVMRSGAKVWVCEELPTIESYGETSVFSGVKMIFKLGKVIYKAKYFLNKEADNPLDIKDANYDRFLNLTLGISEAVAFSQLGGNLFLAYEETTSDGTYQCYRIRNNSKLNSFYGDVGGGDEGYGVSELGLLFLDGKLLSKEQYFFIREEPLNDVSPEWLFSFQGSTYEEAKKAFGNYWTVIYNGFDAATGKTNTTYIFRTNLKNGDWGERTATLRFVDNIIEEVSLTAYH